MPQTATNNVSINGFKGVVRLGIQGRTFHVRDLSIVSGSSKPADRPNIEKTGAPAGLTLEIYLSRQRHYTQINSQGNYFPITVTEKHIFKIFINYSYGKNNFSIYLL